MEWIKNKLNRTSEILQFLYAQRLIGFDVAEVPAFDQGGIHLFEQRLSQAASYLEFGSGGSTLVAACSGVPLISVESDRRFLQAVRRRLVELGAYDETTQKLLYVDIGLTEAWGAPVIRRRTRTRVERWRRYPTAPWAEFERLSGPHLILVDGRFRVACALHAARFLRDREGEVLIDDYSDRNHYHVVARHMDLVGQAGRMALFKPKSSLDPAALEADLECFCSDFR